MVLTTRKIWNKKINESPYREHNKKTIKLVDGEKYEDAGDMANVMNLGKVPTIESFLYTSSGGLTVDGTYVNADAASSIVASTNTIVIKGQDLTATLAVGDKFGLTGTKFNDGTYIVGTIAFSTDTTIVVSEYTYDAGNAAFTSDYSPSLIADETLGIVEEGFETVTTASYTNTDATSSITASTDTILFKGQDLTATLAIGDVFWLDGTESNDGTWTVLTIGFSTDTTIVVVETGDLVDETLNFAAETVTFTTDVVYTDAGTTSTIVAATGTINWLGADLTDYLEVGDLFTIAGCEESAGANNQTYEVATVSSDTTDTIITVTDATGMVDETLDGGTQETLTINDKEITYTNTDATSTLTASTMVIKAQDISAHIVADDTFVIANSDSNDGTYTVATISFSTDTTVTVDETFTTETLEKNPELLRHDTN